jgi:hypothetical protein
MEPQQPELRVGNPEREAVIARLNGALSDGRLDLVEYDDRVRQVYAAKTAGELAPITADLPAPLPPPAPKPSLASHFRLDSAERGWLGMAVMLTGIWLISVVASADHSTHGFWPLWPIGITGVGLLVRRITGG